MKCKPKVQLSGKSRRLTYLFHKWNEGDIFASVRANQPRKGEMKTVSVGVVGVGHLGSRHLKHLLDLPAVDCAGFYDIDPERSHQIEELFGAKAHTSLAALIDVCDALSIVVPTTDHFAVAKECMESGKSVFIEKPMCKTLAEANKLIKLGEEKNAVIQVGHVERLNPAILAIEELALKPKYIETHRLAPYNVRGTEVPVVLDLMIHDLDVILSLVDSPVESIGASGVSIMTSSVDIANARLRFENGCVANITSSRIAKDFVRKLRLFQQDMYVTIDFFLGLTEVYRVLEAGVRDPNAVFTAPLKGKNRERQIVYEKPQVEKIDALKLELENFVVSLAREQSPIVSGEEAREALRIALEIQEKIEQDIH
ncbi:MAG: Gfo/Idh/MocA family oxidoreductase [Candidatus Marinimicrobia bacterium]|nr:oxidoreductase [Candidatus Neomarinimicrobiota bacterium]MDP6836441.1 Gfo/Idh/MocA family oxidoreductase [Candidatus Neomarinimicrobiota bacterium]